MLICIVLITIAFLNILYHYDNKYTSKAALSQDGVFLAPESGICFLADGWEFYPDKLLTPQNFISGSAIESHYKTTLGDYPNLTPFHADDNPYGVSTYRLRIRGNGLYSLYLQEPLCALKVFIGGEVVGENGNVDPENYRPLVRDAVYSFSVDGETELIIQTANYSHYYGGLYYPPALGDADSIGRIIASRMAFYGLLCFSSLALALFSMAVWLGKKGHRDAAAFYFGLLSLSFALRVCYPFLRFWGAPLIRTLYALEDVAALLGIYCVVRISMILFTPHMKDWLQTGICTVSMGMCGVGLVIPLLILPVFPSFTVWYGSMVSWYKLAASLLLVALSVYGTYMQRPYAGFSLATVISYGVCLFANVFSINAFEPIRTGWQDEYGSFLLVLLFGAVMVQRNHAMAAENLRLTEHLQEEVNKKTKHLSMMLDERSQLMAELSHDMKSPITSLSNIVQIIKLGNILLDDEAQDKIKMMEQRCDDLADRLHSIQRLTVETDGLPVMRELSLGRFLSEFHRDIQPVVELSGPDFICNLTLLPCLVLADAEKLRRALENLVFNAADFTPPEGSIQLTLERADGYACIQISDTGCGIQADAVSKVFDRFYTTRSEQGGQGLGLAITKSIIMEHQGAITVQSKVGVGTTFTIHLPLL